MANKLTSFSILFLSTLFTVQAAEVDIGYDSRYISEGRNQFITGGIYWVNGAFDVNEHVSVGIVYGFSSDAKNNYDEFNLSVVYANSVENFDYYIGYTRLEFFKNNESDDEISLGLAYTKTELFTPIVNLIYSKESNGFFFDVGVQKEFEVNEKLAISPYAIVAFDRGYASGVKNGHNHSYMGATISYTLTTRTAISVIVERIFGGSIIKQEGNRTNEFWTGLHFSYSW